MPNAKYNLSSLCYDLLKIFNVEWEDNTIECPSFKVERRSMPQMCFILFGNSSENTDIDKYNYPEFFESWAKPHNQLTNEELVNFIENMYSIDSLEGSDNDAGDIMDLLYAPASNYDNVDSEDFGLSHNDIQIHEICYHAICELYNQYDPYPWVPLSKNVSTDDDIIIETKKRLFFLVIHYCNISNRETPSLGRTDMIADTTQLQHDFEQELEKHKQIILFNVAGTGKSTFCKQYVLSHERSFYYDQPPTSLDIAFEKMFSDSAIWTRICKNSKYAKTLGKHNPYASCNHFEGFTIFIDNIKTSTQISSLSIPKGSQVVYVLDCLESDIGRKDIFCHPFTNISYRRQAIEKLVSYDDCKMDDTPAVEYLFELGNELGDLLSIYRLYASAYRDQRKKWIEKGKTPSVSGKLALETIIKLTSFDGQTDIDNLQNDLSKHSPTISFSQGNRKSTKKSVQAHLRDLINAFLDKQESHLLVLLYRLSNDCDVSPEQLCSCLTITKTQGIKSDTPLESFDLSKYFVRLQELGWIQDSHFKIPQNVAATFNMTSSKTKVKNDILHFFLCFAESVTNTIGGLDGTQAPPINTPLCFNLIENVHKEFLAHILNKKPTEQMSLENTATPFLDEYCNDIIRYYYQSSIQFCIFYSNAFRVQDSAENGHKILMELTNFVDHNPSFYIVNKRYKVFPSHKKKYIDYLTNFHNGIDWFDTNDVSISNYVKDAVEMFEEITKSRKEYNKTGNLNCLEYIAECRAEIVFSFRYFIMACNYYFLLCIRSQYYWEMIKRKIDIDAVRKKFEDIIKLLECFSQNIIVDMNESSIIIHKIYDRTIDIIKYTVAMLFSSFGYHDNILESYKTDIQCLRFNNESSPIICQELLVSRMILAFISAMQGTTMPDFLYEDISYLYARCGDLPFIIEKIKEATNYYSKAMSKPINVTLGQTNFTYSIIL